jgi:ABC-type bacteriocin/lantibiotic exporter with double-glycine peptidase domain
VRSNTLIVDLVIGVVVAIILIVVSPGLAVVGIIAILVLVGCALSFVFERRRARRSGGTKRRSVQRPSPRRPPTRPARRR